MSLWESLEGESVKVISGGGSKFPGGLYLVSIECRPDRVTASIYASRATSLTELREQLTLKDSVGTDYSMQLDASDIIDGKDVIEFVPGLPPAATWLSLGVPGNRFWVTTLREQSDAE